MNELIRSQAGPAQGWQPNRRLSQRTAARLLVPPFSSACRAGARDSTSRRMPC